MRRYLSVAVAACLFGALIVSARPVLAQSEWGVRGPSRTNNSTPAFNRTVATPWDFQNTGSSSPLLRVCGSSGCTLGGYPALTLYETYGLFGGSIVRGANGLTLDTANAGAINLNPAAAYDVNIAASTRLDFVGSSWHATNATMGLRLPQNTAITCPVVEDGYLAFDTDDDKLGVCAGTPGALTFRTMFSSADVVGVANGGTGLAAGTSGGLLAYTATGTLASSALLTQYGVVYGGGAGVTPSATAAGTTGEVLQGNTGAAPTWGAVPAVTTFADTGIANMGMYVATGGCASPETVTIGADVYEYDADGVAPCNGHICVQADAGAVLCASRLVTAINASGTEAYTAMSWTAAGSVYIYGDTVATAAVGTTDTVALGAWQDAGLGANTAQGRLAAQRQISTAYRVATAAEASADVITFVFPFTPVTVVALSDRASYIKMSTQVANVVTLSVATLTTGDTIRVIATE